jgi:hypothetical protein
MLDTLANKDKYDKDGKYIGEKLNYIYDDVGSPLYKYLNDLN